MVLIQKATPSVIKSRFKLNLKPDMGTYVIMHCIINRKHDANKKVDYLVHT